MAWIRTIPPGEAEGALKREYDAAIKRAGRVFHILRIQSLNPGMLKESMRMYLAIMHGPSPLSRLRRELLATVVSAANRCHY